METYWVWEYGLFEKNPKRQDSLNPETTLEVIKAADAQATIAALQARVQELEAQHEDLVERNRILRHRPDLPVERTEFHDRFVKLQSQLTQRTAELEAAKAIQAIDLKNNNAYREQVATLQAELERVRADNKALDEWRADVTVSLQRPGGAFFVDVPQHIKDLVKERDDLRTLLLALPKVDGEIMVSESLVLAEDPDMCSDMSDKEEATAYAALLKRRQGMEG